MKMTCASGKEGRHHMLRDEFQAGRFAAAGNPRVAKQWESVTADDKLVVLMIHTLA